MTRVRIIGPGRAGTSLDGHAATVQRHLAALPPDERPVYDALAREAGRLCR